MLVEFKNYYFVLHVTAKVDYILDVNLAKALNSWVRRIRNIFSSDRM